MKKYIIPIMMLAAIVSCRKNPVASSGEGYISFAESGLELDTEVETRASAASGSYAVIITDSEGNEVVRTTYSSIISAGNLVSLPAGEYTISARSTAEEVPVAAFEQPVYGVSKKVSVSAGQTTSAGSLVCTLLQTKVTVSYSDEFKQMITGNGSTTVTVNPSSPLVYNLTYNNGNPYFDQNAGYFAVNNGANTTMEVKFSGQVDGQSAKMTKVFTGIQPKTWHQIKFVKKVDATGTASFSIVIDGLLEDEELGNDLTVSENIIGDDPKAPKGDGGIALESTCSYDISQPIVVPAMGNPFVLTMKAIVPGGVKKFTVEIASTNDAFTNSVGAVNDGQTTLDLVNPSSGAIQVFTEILPFPYGDAVAGKTEIDFDLSAAQEPILAFEGTHSFVMHVTDMQGCKNDIPVQMVVSK